MVRAEDSRGLLQILVLPMAVMASTTTTLRCQPPPPRRPSEFGGGGGVQLASATIAFINALDADAAGAVGTLRRCSPHVDAAVVAAVALPPTRRPLLLGATSSRHSSHRNELGVPARFTRERRRAAAQHVDLQSLALAGAKSPKSRAPVVPPRQAGQPEGPRVPARPGGVDQGEPGDPLPRKPGAQGRRALLCLPDPEVAEGLVPAQRGGDGFAAGRGARQ